jgi:hypothetical protein
MKIDTQIDMAVIESVKLDLGAAAWELAEHCKTLNL